MKKILLPLLAAATLLALPAFTPAGAPRSAPAVSGATETYVAQLNLTSVGWQAKTVGDMYWGSVPVKDGTLRVNGSQVVGGSFTFDLANLELDEEDDVPPNPRLLAQLKSDDFFATEKYPTATFVITSLKPGKLDGRGNNAEITGNLTIKGITRPLTFTAHAGVKDGVASAIGTATIDRTEFGITYGSKSLLGTAADKVIDDVFIISFNLIAKKAARS